MSNPSLSHIPAFHAVMQSGSLSAAARHLRLAHPTVRRQIEALEAELGVALFTRAANGLTPTPMAESLMPFATSVLEQAAALARAATTQADAVEGVVRITTSRIVATHVMPDVLAPLSRTAPALRFELAATDRDENLAHRAADIALRFSPPKQQALVALRLKDVEVGLFAAPGFDLPENMQDLGDLPFISDDREARILAEMARVGFAQPSNIILRCDDPLAQLAHLEAGLGIGLCQVKLAGRRGLHRVLPQVSYQMPCWLVMHEDQARTPRIRAVYDHLKAELPHWI